MDAKGRLKNADRSMQLLNHVRLISLEREALQALLKVSLQSERSLPEITDGGMTDQNPSGSCFVDPKLKSDGNQAAAIGPRSSTKAGSQKILIIVDFKSGNY